MVPFLAQGAVMAIEDGFVLARALAGSGDVPSSLLKYENARKERTRRTVEGSANIARFHNRALADPRTVREYVEREWAGANVAESYEWLFTYGATAVSFNS